MGSVRRGFRGEYQTLLEDVFETKVFRILWGYQNHWVNVVVFKIESHGEDGPLFRSSRNYNDLVSDPNDAEVYLEGYVKWDGCAELNQGQPHWCSVDDFQYHCHLIKYIYHRSFELMGREPVEEWVE